MVVVADNPPFSANELWALTGALEASFIIFFATFLVLIPPKHRYSFFSAVTSKQFAVRKFRAAKTDEERIDVFSVSQPNPTHPHPETLKV